VADRKAFTPMDAGYIEVKDRIIAFLEKYPHGSLQSEIVELSENLVVVKGIAYREPDDERPGVGHSQMPIPGKSSFTRDSEIENAETSAWGRALAALGFEVKRSIASAEEVANKTGGDPPIGPTERVASGSAGDEVTPAQKRRLMAQGKKLFGDEDSVRAFVKEQVGKFSSSQLTREDIDVLFNKMDEIESALVEAEAVAAGTAE
jgi:hypothetical protein